MQGGCALLKQIDQSKLWDTSEEGAQVNERRKRGGVKAGTCKSDSMSGRSDKRSGCGGKSAVVTA